MHNGLLQAQWCAGDGAGCFCWGWCCWCAGADLAGADFAGAGSWSWCWCRFCWCWQCWCGIVGADYAGAGVDPAVADMATIAVIQVPCFWTFVLAFSGLPKWHNCQKKGPVNTSASLSYAALWQKTLLSWGCLWAYVRAGRCHGAKQESFMKSTHPPILV